MLERQDLQKLYQYCFSLTQDSHNAHDLLQTALEKWVKSGQAGDNPGAYVRRIIRNQFIDDCRRYNCVAFEPLDEHSPMTLSENVLEKQFIEEDLTEQLLEKMNNAEREVLFMSAVLGYSASEIADELDTSRGNILSRLFRVKKKAQDMMKSLESTYVQRVGRRA